MAAPEFLSGVYRLAQSLCSLHRDIIRIGALPGYIFDVNNTYIASDLL